MPKRRAAQKQKHKAGPAVLSEEELRNVQGGGNLTPDSGRNSDYVRKNMSVILCDNSTPTDGE